MSLFEFAQDDYIIYYSKKSIPLEDNANIRNSIFYQISNDSIILNNVQRSFSLFNSAFLKCTVWDFCSVFMKSSDQKSCFNCCYCIFSECSSYKLGYCIRTELESKSSPSLLSNICCNNCPAKGTPWTNTIVLFGGFVVHTESNISNCVSYVDLYYSGNLEVQARGKYLTFSHSYSSKHGLLTLTHGDFYLGNCNFLNVADTKYVIYSYEIASIEVEKSNFFNVGSFELFMISGQSNGYNVADCYFDKDPVYSNGVIVTQSAKSPHESHLCIVKLRRKSCRRCIRRTLNHSILLSLNFILSLYWFPHQSNCY